MRLVPEKRNRLPGHMLDRPEGIVITIGTRKDDDAEFHGSLRLVRNIVSLARLHIWTMSPKHGQQIYLDQFVLFLPKGYVRVHLHGSPSGPRARKQANQQHDPADGSQGPRIR